MKGPIWKKSRSVQHLCTIDNEMGDDKIKQMCDVGEGRLFWNLQIGDDNIWSAPHPGCYNLDLRFAKCPP